MRKHVHKNLDSADNYALRADSYLWLFNNGPNAAIFKKECLLDRTNDLNIHWGLGSRKWLDIL